MATDTPIAGYYRMKLSRGGAPAGIRVWHGQPLDPHTGEEMDRSLRWQAQCNGRAIDIDRVWPRCAGEPISEADYLDHCRAAEEDRTGVVANPHRAADIAAAPSPFGPRP